MNSMDMTRLSELLDAYGADPGRWPASERAAALALLAASDAARAQQRIAAQLDEALDLHVVAPPSSLLRSAVIAAAERPRSRWRLSFAELWRDLGGWQLAGPAFAASLALGAWVPIWLDETATDLPDEDLIAAMQLVDELPEWTP